jgi:sulfonate transport system substrate-binding protein
MPKKKSFLVLAAALSALTVLSGCGGDAEAGGGSKLALDAALPTEVPDGVKIVVGDPATQKALELSGQIDKVSKFVQFANLSGGPQTTEAFRAKALDLGSVAEIPPIHATWTGLHVKIVASKFRQDAINHPIYQLGVAPGVQVKSLADLRGKKIAYSPGQAQGALVLKVLKKAGLTKDDVKFVELPSTGDVYSNALAAKQVEVAPIGGVQIKRYLTKYGKDGASTIQHGLRDDAGHLYGPTESLEDAGKAAAIRAYVAAWGVAQEWIDKHPKEWIEGYYVKDQGLTTADGEWLVENAGHPDISADWSDAIKRQQETIELLAKETGNKVIQAADLYDLRFQSVASDAIKAAAK